MKALVMIYLYVKYESPIPHGYKNILSYLKAIFSLKVGQTSRSRSLGQKSHLQMKALVIRNQCVKYQSPNPNSSKDIAQVKVSSTDADADEGMTLALRYFRTGELTTAISPPYKNS